MAGQARTGVRGASLARTLFLTTILVVTGAFLMWLFRWGGLQSLEDRWKKQQEADAGRVALQVVKNHRFTGELSLATRLETIGRTLTQKGTPMANPEWKVTPVAGKPGAWMVSATLRGPGVEETFTWNARVEKGEVLAADANAQRLDDIEHAVAGKEGMSSTPRGAGTPSARVARTNPFQPPEVSPRARGSSSSSPRWPTSRPQTASPPHPPSKPANDLRTTPPPLSSAHIDLELIGVTKARNTVVALVRYQGRLREVWQGSTLADGWRVKEINPLGRAGTTLVVMRGQEKQVFRLALEGPPAGSGRAAPSLPPREPPREPPPVPPAPQPSAGGFPSLPDGPRDPAPSGEPPGDGAPSPPPVGPEQPPDKH